MKISILIPTHNRPKLFRRALRSVLCALPDYQIEIIVNNDTSDISEIYSPNVNIKYYYNEYNDISHIYHFLYNMAAGEYIYYLEDDDFLNRSFFNKIDFTFDINYMEYISEPLIRERGFYASHKSISINREHVDNNCAYSFVNKFDDEEFQLGQILFRKDLVDKFPEGNNINNDLTLLKNIAKPGVTINYIMDQLWTQTTDGRDNISFPEYNTDERFN